MELWPGGPIELPHAFTIDGDDLTLPEIPTHRLLGWLATGAWWELLHSAADAEQILPLAMRFHNPDDELDFEHFHDIAIVLFGRLAGTAAAGTGSEWWPGVRMAASAVTSWSVFTAWCTSHGADPLDGPLWQVIGRIYGWLRDRAGPAQLDKLDRQIWAPPPFTPSAAERVPQHVRDEEAALALAALGETLPGEDRGGEWTG